MSCNGATEPFIGCIIYARKVYGFGGRFHGRYRQKALRFHPDNDKAPEAVLEFARVCEAYDVLRDREYILAKASQLMDKEDLSEILP